MRCVCVCVCLQTHGVFVPSRVVCREETEPASTEHTARPRKRKADVAIVSTSRPATTSSSFQTKFHVHLLLTGAP